jgi:hypothetical protein
MKNFSKWVIKAAVAGIVALALLCLWCSFYYNVPVHYTNETGATEYKWQANKFFRKGTEGFAFGRTNNDGFNNLLDYEQGESIDILVMGSSHMEAMNVAADENATAQLNQLFGGEKYAYNIGTSGHTLMYCLKHLDSALDTYAPGEYVVIETRTLSFSDSELEAVLDGTLPDIPSHNGGITGLLQKLCYLRLLYTKYFNQSGEDTTQAAESGEQLTTNTAELTQLLNRAAESCQAKGVQLIIVYDPVVYVDENGVGYTDTQSGDLEAMESACAESGAWLIDLTDSYLEGYNTQHKLPYGFANTSPGNGHMNSWGHKLFAQAVYEAVKEGAA